MFFQLVFWETADTGESLKTIQGMSNLYAFLADEQNSQLLSVLEDNIQKLITETDV